MGQAVRPDSGIPTTTVLWNENTFSATTIAPEATAQMEPTATSPTQQKARTLGTHNATETQ